MRTQIAFKVKQYISNVFRTDSEQKGEMIRGAAGVLSRRGACSSALQARKREQSETGKRERRRKREKNISFNFTMDLSLVRGREFAVVTVVICRIKKRK